MFCLFGEAGEGGAEFDGGVGGVGEVGGFDVQAGEEGVHLLERDGGAVGVDPAAALGGD